MKKCQIILSVIVDNNWDYYCREEEWILKSNYMYLLITGSARLTPLCGAPRLRYYNIDISKPG